LHKAAGERIARLLNVESAMVTSGAAGAIALAWPGACRNIFELRIQPNLTGQFSRRGIGGDRMRNGYGRF